MVFLSLLPSLRHEPTVHAHAEKKKKEKATSPFVRTAGSRKQSKQNKRGIFYLHRDGHKTAVDVPYQESEKPDRPSREPRKKK